VRPAPVSTQSPQFRRPSDAVHGRSKAKRKTLTVATRIAAPQTGHGRENTAAYCAERAAPITLRSLRALDDAERWAGDAPHGAVARAGRSRVTP
jgi:hypothetical protein